MTVLTATALILRTVLAFLPGHSGDMRYFAAWAGFLTERPASALYKATGRYAVDHLPPDMAIHWLVSHAFRLFSSAPFSSGQYRTFMTVLPTAADWGLALLAFVVARRLHGNTLGVLAFGLVLLSPPFFMTSSLWGQWDSIPLLLLAAAGFFSLARPRWWGLAFGLAVYAVFIKPPLAVLVIPMVAVPFGALLLQRRGSHPDAPARRGFRGFLINTAVGSAIGLSAVWAVSAIFNVAFVSQPGKHALPELISKAADKYRFTTLNAPNLWGMLQDPKHRVLDTRPGFLGISAHQTGSALFLAAAAATGAVVVVLLWRRMQREQSAVRGQTPLWVYGLWGGAMLSWSSVFFLTRAHERYLLPAVAMSLLLAIIANRASGWAAFGLLAVASTLCTWGALLQDAEKSLPLWLWTTACWANLLGGLLMAGLAWGWLRAARVSLKA